MPFDWLFRGEWEWTYATTERQAIIAGKSPQVVKVITAMRTMTEWEQSKVLRMLIRMGNNDPKVSRLSDMRDLGQISVQQFLAMM